MKFKNEQEVHDYLKWSKVHANLNNEEIQKVLFNYGFRRETGYDELLMKKITSKEIGNKNHSFIYIMEDVFSTNDNRLVFNDWEHKELYASEILSIEIMEVPKKYEFKTFDKVLMIYDEKWIPCFFRTSLFYIEIETEDHHTYTKYSSLDGRVSRHCIPYEGNESLIDKPYNYEDKE